MLLAPPGALGDLSTLVLGNHALKLEHQFLFRCCCFSRFEKHDIHTMAGQLFKQQNLVGILAAQPIRRKNQHSLELSFGGKVPQSFQSRANKHGAAVSLIKKNPFIEDRVAFTLSTLPQSRNLTLDRSIRLLSLGGDSGVNRRWLHLL
ncbi:MAG: hypothetical protein AUK55_12185 [Syntrophobacteraceae bacterium CG2_30_61_12]|nr:MAG: hypothetical protein AUK55_12185 [Syntrophobacteraceae bacterium CG2_30_61_12]